ncbi:hypothetical protein ACWCWD_18090 [Streptomyces sp. NPDC001493]
MRNTARMVAGYGDGMRTVGRLPGCVLLAVVLAACTSDDTNRAQGERRPTLDMEQAGQRAEDILDGTLAAVRPSVAWSHGSPVEAACSAGLNEPTGTTTVTRSRNILTVVSDERRGNLLGAVQRYWKEKGFTIQSVNSDASMPSIRAKAPDGFAVALEVGSIGNVSVSAGLSCAANSAVTYPAGTPGVPGGPKAEEVRPGERSAFWSSSEPLS